MTHTEMLKSLIKAGEEMRTAQSLYFAMRLNKNMTKKEKAELLMNANMLAGQFDNLVYNLKQLVNP